MQALIQAGYEVDVLCLRGSDDLRVSREHGANIYRIKALSRKRGGRLRYLAEYGTFWLSAMWFLTRRQITQHYEVILVLTLPDFLVFSTAFARLFGAKVIIDMRECMPEMYKSAYGTDNGLGMKAVVASEQLSLRFADMALTCTDQMRETYASRGANPQKIGVMLNVADPSRTNHPSLPDPDKPLDAPFTIVMHGTIKERYGHRVLIEAMARVVQLLPQARLVIMGSGPDRAMLENLAFDLGLDDVVEFAGFVPEAELMRQLHAADCGVVPLISTAETELIHTFKMFEYMALGVPVVISRTWAVDAYFDNSTVAFFEPGNSEDLARAIVELHDDPARRYHLAKNALDWYEKYGPMQQREEFLKVVEKLVDRRLVN